MLFNDIRTHLLPNKWYCSGYVYIAGQIALFIGLHMPDAGQLVMVSAIYGLAIVSTHLHMFVHGQQASDRSTVVSTRYYNHPET